MPLASLLRWAAWAASVGAAYWVWHPALEMPMDVIAEVFSGTGLYLLGIIGVRALYDQRDDARLQAAGSGRPLKDGAILAIAGTIVEVGPPITAPATLQPCVAYQYELTHEVVIPATNRRSASRATLTAALGFGMTTFAVRHPQGDVRVHGFPTLTLPFRHRISDRALTNLGAHFAAHPPTIVRAGKPMERRVEALQRQTGERVREDWAPTAQPVTPDGTTALANASATEFRLEAGRAVVAIGRYDASRAALVPRPRFGAKAIQVLAGDPAAALALSRAERKTLPLLQAGFALVLMLIPVWQFLTAWNTVTADFRHLDMIGRLWHLLHLGPGATT